MSLTLTKNGTPPISRVTSPRGFYYVYLSPTAAPREQKSSSRMKSKLPSASIKQITLALQHGLTLDELYSAFSPSSQLTNGMREFNVAHDDEVIEIMPDPYPSRYYIAGPSGAGKTYVAATLARNYSRIYPDRDIILFARQADDPAFKDVQREEIVLDEREQEQKGRSLDELAEEIGSVPLEDFSRTLVICDDCDNLEHKSPLYKRMVSLVSDLMCNGRKMEISTIYISHIMLNAHQSKVPLNESQYVFFFPGSGTRGIRVFLKEYAGMENKEIKRILDLKSRWIMLSRNIPRYIATEKSIFLL